MNHTSLDYSCYVEEGESQHLNLYLQVDGMRCAACAFRIESTLNAIDGVEARINYSTQRLKISWLGKLKARANEFAKEIEALGFKVAPFDMGQKLDQKREEEKFLLRCLAVAAFGTGNVMLFSQALWFSPEGSIFGATRDVMHWMMAIIALPTIIYAGQPFFASALGALKHGRTNMDVPISLAVILASALSLYETQTHGDFVYFDASVMLLFFLLIGRYLDSKARGKAREAAEGLLAMLEGTATVMAKDGALQSVRIRDLVQGQTLLITAGEKVSADGVVMRGESEIDTHMVTGETMPRQAKVGDKLFAGMINLTAPIELNISAASDQSLLSEVVALMEKAEQGQAKYVRLADRVSRLYAPVVHALALITFIGWMVIGPRIAAYFHWEQALLNAMAVLIITCPCALGLAVPVVQVIASSYLFKKGILLKSGKGLETLAAIDTVVFDKTGTLTSGEPRCTNLNDLPETAYSLVLAMASKSRHPLSQALARALADKTDICVTSEGVEDSAGLGLQFTHDGARIRLGKGSWVGAEQSNDNAMEMWYREGEAPPIRLTFEDALRSDSAKVVAALKAQGIKTIMLSGDRKIVAQSVASQLGLDEAVGDLSPVDKVKYIETLQANGRKVLMVGDGLNDAAALAAAYVSMSPSSGVDITQNAAEIVYRGQNLSPVFETWQVAKRTQTLVVQNLSLSVLYNVLAIPMAVIGWVTPLIAALAMSGSSLLVIGNAFRLKWGIKKA